MNGGAPRRWRGKAGTCRLETGDSSPDQPADSMALIEAIRDEDVFLLEAFMYRCHPQTAKIVELVKSKIIGEVRLIQANFSFNFGEQPRTSAPKRRPGRRRHHGRGLLHHLLRALSPVPRGPGWSRRSDAK